MATPGPSGPGQNPAYRPAHHFHDVDLRRRAARRPAVLTEPSTHSNWSTQYTDPRTTADLHGVGLKLDRAIKHLRDLEQEVENYCEEGPFTLVFDHELRSGFHIGRAINVQEPPPTLSLILGDLVNNLRSALDHLVWQLVLASGTWPGWWNSFPLYSYPKKFKTKVVEPYKRGKPSPLLGVDGRLLPLFESYQPYPGGDGKVHGFAILRDVSNVDKHQVLHSRLFAIAKDEFEIERARGFEHCRIQVKHGPVEEGEEVFRVQLLTTRQPGDDPDDVQLETVSTADIRFGDDYVSMKTIGGIVNNVINCINEFCDHVRPLTPPGERSA